MLSFTTASGSFDVTIDAANDNLDGLARAINAADAGVTAIVVADGGGFRLMVKGKTGAAEDFTITTGATTGLELFASADMTETQEAKDAIVRIDGLEVTRSSNSFSDLIPGVDNEITVTPTETGSYVGRCAEYCGLDHWRMNYTVRVVPADEFEAWLDEQPRTEERVEVDEDEDTAGSGGRADAEGSGDPQVGPTGEGGP